MNFFKLYKNFQKDEDGAVTVDWVVLTAAVVGLGLLVMNGVKTSVSGLGGKISTAIDAVEPDTTTTTTTTN